MKISGFQYYPYSIKLGSPFTASSGTITERKGFIISFSSAHHRAYGEAAPLPEFGSESYKDAEEILGALGSIINLKGNIDENSHAIEDLLSPLDNFPALHHGIEQAMLNLAAFCRDTSLPAFLNLKTGSTVEVNSVIGLLPPEEVLRTARIHYNSGYRTIKLKAGRKNFADDIKTLSLLRDTFGNKISLRIDVNGKWTAESASENCERLRQFGLEYIEQPVPDNDMLRELVQFTDIPLAADESVRSMKDAVHIIDKRCAQVLILKPMMTGGILNTLKIIAYAQMNDVRAVISSSFETEIGKRAAVLLAASVKEKTAHGLGTFLAPVNNSAHSAFPVENGIIKINDENSFHTIQDDWF